VFYFMLKHDTHAKLHPDVIDQQPPAYRLWRDFVADDSLEMRDRFKVWLVQNTCGELAVVPVYLFLTHVLGSTRS
jgi:hypothetical protein